MKTGIHPKLNQIMVRCSCGHELETLSTMDQLTVPICSACHPFFTGKQKIVDAAGRVERFQKRYTQQAPAKKGPRAITIS